MNIEDRVRALVLEKIADREDLFIVDIKMHTNGKLIVLIDGDEGITIQDCAAVSRHVGFHLEEENAVDHAYNLEVSSPGVDIPLTTERQYRKNIGRQVQLKMVGPEGEGEVQREGVLLAVTEQGLSLEAIIQNKNLPKGRKPAVEMLDIPFKNILVTKVLISFK